MFHFCVCISNKVPGTEDGTDRSSNTMINELVAFYYKLQYAFKVPRMQRSQQ
jgi:hypothetical protein